MSPPKLTPKQIEESWKQLTASSRSKSKVSSEPAGLIKQDFDVSTLSQDEKNKQLIQVFDGGSILQFEELLRHGGQIDLGIILEDCIRDSKKWEFAKIAVNYDQKDSNPLNSWFGLTYRVKSENLPASLELFRELKIPISKESIQLVWKHSNTPNLFLFLKSSIDFFPKKWTNIYQKILENHLDSAIERINDTDKEYEIHSHFATDMAYFIQSIEKYASQTPNLDPFKSYRGGEKGLDVWSEFFENEKYTPTTQHIKTILSYGVYPPPQKYSSISRKEVSWAWKAAEIGAVDVFYFLMQDPIQKKLFEEDAKNWDESCFSRYSGPFFFLILPALNKVGFDFSKTPGKDNYFFHALSNWNYYPMTGQEGYKLNKEEEKSLVENFQHILVKRSPREKSIAEHASQDWSEFFEIETTSFGNLSWFEFQSMLEKEKLKVSLPNGILPSNKLRI